MFGQNVGFNGFTVNTQIQTNNNAVNFLDGNGFVTGNSVAATLCGFSVVASIPLKQALKIAFTRVAPKVAMAAADGPSPVLDIVATLWLCYDIYDIVNNYNGADLSSDISSDANDDNHGGSIPDDSSVTGHIFDPTKDGHMPEDTPENRQKLDDVGNDEDSYLGRYQYGNDWHGRINEDGSQTWTESRNGRIFDGGVNKEPIPFNPKTGLKSPERPW